MGSPSFLFFLSIVISFSVLESAPVEGAEANWVSSTQTGILALDSAKRAVLQDIAEQAISERQAADYEDFIAYLNSRIITYCQELKQKAGSAFLADLPCLADTVGQSSSYPLTELDSISSGSTSAECSDALDTSFMGALADFDDMLLREEEKISSRIPSKREAGGGGDDGSGKSGIGGTGSSQQGTSASPGMPGSPGTDQTAGPEGTVGEKADSSTGEDGGSSGGTGVDGEGQGGALGTASGNRPPPKDDDIVARQLWEAAQKETDPELKKKLWEEYWKYKGK